MESFHWGNDFITNIEEVDKQHHHLVDLINNFGKNIVEIEIHQSDIELMFKELFDYTDYHFSTEENLMENIGIDKRHFEYHIQEHKHFLNEILHMKNLITPENPDSVEELLKFLIHWLAYHILGCDQNMAKQLKAIESGKMASEAYDEEEKEHDRATDPLLYALDELFRQLTKRNIKLNDLNENLERRVKEEVQRNRKKDQLLFQQSRLAQMGEMISMIAHQWRQPLGAISSTSIDIKMKSELKYYDLTQKQEAQKYETYVNSSLNEIDDLIQNLTTTIDDFKNFYKPNKELATVKLQSVVLKPLNIIKASLINANIEIIEEYNSKEEIELYDNEMMQVILNILKNTQDNFIEKALKDTASHKIKDPYIKITTNNKTISICDNGGGIPEDILPNIFDPYFSTKDEKSGTGLGLYMSKIIVEKHHKGKLTAQNIDNGVCFTIELGIISEYY